MRGTTVKARLNRLGLELTAVKAFVVSCIGRDVLGLGELRSNAGGWSISYHRLNVKAKIGCAPICNFFCFVDSQRFVNAAVDIAHVDQDSGLIPRSPMQCHSKIY